MMTKILLAVMAVVLGTHALPWYSDFGKPSFGKSSFGSSFGGSSFGGSSFGDSSFGSSRWSDFDARMNSRLAEVEGTLNRASGRSKDPYNEPGEGVCFVDVPTSSITNDPTQLSKGNSTNPGMTRVRQCCQSYKQGHFDPLKCEPVCTKPCVNGVCMSPDVCGCYPDFVKNAGGFCIPYCPTSCQNGYCDGNTCKCNSGYTLEFLKKYCIPTCERKCGGFGIGNCTAYNTCDCGSGYKATAHGDCDRDW